MARPKAKELTTRELEVMHVFWDQNQVDPVTELTVSDVRDAMQKAGRDLAYTTVATLVRILVEKGFLNQTNEERPFLYRAVRSFDEVSGNMLGEMIQKVFGGSREKLLMRLMEERKLTPKELKALEDILRENS
ncbi:MAG: BlaI/MecI/CopY family transcriptional regulator [Planctomycetes bacterium]|nr:BlaI/MecI/CopY family transcriptional regulator [Planctomycetota bacterium]MCH9726523.1 BlaI/MecI/CopY family transcriptional regulator [Planctomycetota bacterium]MCH9776335.1 BlaI/MecI/CopY family transcriptional regulator [Planctomycetota bacterium]MCH9793559.1 BlaI/MecI/CopY family transcriptional regulator [Planctomycetota bacterium]MDF1744470.1 BlaI/MecI/CopY family transcriptional regulator [Gimesia sp.]